MSIQSLGVGSGLDLESLVGQLLNAERTPKVAALDRRESAVESTISSFGKLKSKLSDFQTSLEDLLEASDLQSRKPLISEPSEDIEVLEATAGSKALEGAYQVTVQQLASGSRIETVNAQNGGFADSADSVLSSGTGKLTFSLASDSDSFSIDVTAGMTLTELREAINANEDNFGVSANIIDTGTADGVKLVFLSEKTGKGNDLIIENTDDIAELQKLSTTDSTGTASYLSPVVAADNAKAVIDGIAVESSSNEFENTIQNVSFTVKDVSPFGNDGVTRQATELNIGLDKDATKEKIEAFVEKYNSLVDEIDSLTSYGETDADADGALAGDSMTRGIRQGLSSIVGSAVAGNALGGLFSIGVELDSDGRLEIGSSDFGLGSGAERLDDALDDNFDEIANLFASENTGIAYLLNDFVEQYISSSGLISSRETTAKSEQDAINDDRATLELRMASYEDTLRDKYLNLDQTVARLNQTSQALLSSLG